FEVADTDLPYYMMKHDDVRIDKLYNHFGEVYCKRTKGPFCEQFNQLTRRRKVVNCMMAQDPMNTFCKLVKYGPIDRSNEILKYYWDLHQMYLQITSQLLKDQKHAVDC